MICYLSNQTTHCVRAGGVRDVPTLHIVDCTNCGFVAHDSAAHIDTSHYENSGMHEQAVQSMTQWLHDTSHDDQRRFDVLKPVIVNSKVLDFGSYELVDQAEIVVFIDSTLAFESIGRGKKQRPSVAAAPFGNEKSLKFGWPR